MIDTALRIDELLRELQSAYPLSKDAFTVAEKPFEIFCIKNVDLLLNELMAKGEEDEEVLDERLPYWAEVWPSALALGEFIFRHSEITANSSVHEIGCGIGLSGMIAKQLGASVILSDYLNNALKLAELNWLHNGLQPDQVEMMDWRKPKQNLSADFIIASDILYEKRFFQPIIDCFKTTLNPGGTVYLSEPNREIAIDFFELLDLQGFKYVQHQIETKTDMGFYPVNVYELYPGPS